MRGLEHMACPARDQASLPQSCTVRSAGFSSHSISRNTFAIFSPNFTGYVLGKWVFNRCTYTSTQTHWHSPSCSICLSHPLRAFEHFCASAPAAPSCINMARCRLDRVPKSLFLLQHSSLSTLCVTELRCKHACHFLCRPPSSLLQAGLWTHSFVTEGEFHHTTVLFADSAPYLHIQNACL